MGVKFGKCKKAVRNRAEKIAAKLFLWYNINVFFCNNKLEDIKKLIRSDEINE